MDFSTPRRNQAVSALASTAAGSPMRFSTAGVMGLIQLISDAVAIGRFMPAHTRPGLEAVLLTPHPLSAFPRVLTRFSLLMWPRTSPTGLGSSSTD